MHPLVALQRPSHPSRLAGLMLSRRSASAARIASASDATRGSIAHAGTAKTGAPGTGVSDPCTRAVKISTLTGRRALVGIRAAGNYKTRGGYGE